MRAHTYAYPQDTYGLEKLYHEEMCKAYAADFPLETRMARYHNVYGPRGTWKVGSLPINTLYMHAKCVHAHTPFTQTRTLCGCRVVMWAGYGLGRVLVVEGVPCVYLDRAGGRT